MRGEAEGVRVGGQWREEKKKRIEPVLTWSRMKNLGEKKNTNGGLLLEMIFKNKKNCCLVMHMDC